MDKNNFSSRNDSINKYGDPVTVNWLMPNAGSPVVEVFIDN